MRMFLFKSIRLDWANKILVSSEKIIGAEVLFIILGKSFTYRRKGRGPKTEPYVCLTFSQLVSQSFLYDALKGCIVALTALVRGYSPLLLPVDTLVFWLTPAPLTLLLTFGLAFGDWFVEWHLVLGRGQCPRRTVWSKWSVVWRLEKGLSYTNYLMGAKETCVSDISQLRPSN